MLVVDANVLLYAVNSTAADHERARTWLDRALAGHDTLAISWTVLLAFVRLSTHPAVFPTPLTPAQAIDVVRTWLGSMVAQPIEPSAEHLDSLARLLADAGTGGNLVADAHLAALAIDHDATLVSFDRDFARFPGLRWEVPAGP